MDAWWTPEPFHETGSSLESGESSGVRLAAPLIDTYEEKEAITMARQTPTKGEPAKQVAVDVLRKPGEPLHAKTSS